MEWLLILMILAFIGICTIVGFIVILVWFINLVTGAGKKKPVPSQPVRQPASQPPPAPAAAPAPPPVPAETPPPAKPVAPSPPVTPPPVQPVVQTPPATTQRKFTEKKVVEEKRESFFNARRIGEFLTRNALYAGIVCAFVALVGAIIRYRDVLPAWTKISMLLGGMAGVYLLGRWLRHKRGYPRTGLALMLVSAVWLPLNYLGFLSFRVITLDAWLYLSWGYVSLACAVIYGIVTFRLRERSFAFLTLLTLLCAPGFFLWHWNAERAIWQAVYGVMAFGLLWLSILKPRPIRLFRIPAVWLSFILALLTVIFSFVPYNQYPAVTQGEYLWYRFAFLALFIYIFQFRVRHLWVAILFFPVLTASAVTGWIASDRLLNIWPFLLAALACNLCIVLMKKMPGIIISLYKAWLGVMMVPVFFTAAAVCVVTTDWIWNITALAVLVVYCFASYAVTGWRIMRAAGWGYAIILAIVVARYPDVTFMQQIWFVSCGITGIAILNFFLPAALRCTKKEAWAWYGIALVLTVPVCAYILVERTPPDYLCQTAWTTVLLWAVLYITWRSRAALVFGSINLQAAWFVSLLVVPRLMNSSIPPVTVCILAAVMYAYGGYTWIRRDNNTGITPLSLLSDSLIFSMVFGMLFTWRYYVYAPVIPPRAQLLGITATAGFAGVVSGLIRRGCSDAREALYSILSIPLFCLAFFAFLDPSLELSDVETYYRLSWAVGALAAVAGIMYRLRRPIAGVMYQVFATLFLGVYCLFALENWPVPWWSAGVMFAGHMVLVFCSRNIAAILSSQAAAILFAITLGYHFSADLKGYAHGLLICGSIYAAGSIVSAFLDKKKLAAWFGVSTALLWITAYYVYLAAYDIDETAAYLWIPAAVVIVACELLRRSGLVNVLFRNVFQTLGLLIYFLPMYVIIIGETELAQHLPFLIGAGLVFAGALWVKNRWLFHSSLLLIVVDALTLLVQVIKFHKLPVYIYFAIASVLLLSIGLLFERNLNILIRRQLSSMKDAYKAFFEEWE
jgi:hypothetical protein